MCARSIHACREVYIHIRTYPRREWKCRHSKQTCVGLHMCKNMCLEYSFLGIPPTVADFFFFLLKSLVRKRTHVWSECVFRLGCVHIWGYIYGRTYAWSDWNHRGKYTRDGLHIPENTHIRWLGCTHWHVDLWTPVRLQVWTLECAFAGEVCGRPGTQH